MWLGLNPTQIVVFASLCGMIIALMYFEGKDPNSETDWFALFCIGTSAGTVVELIWQGVAYLKDGRFEDHLIHQLTPEAPPWITGWIGLDQTTEYLAQTQVIVWVGIPTLILIVARPLR